MLGRGDKPPTKAMMEAMPYTQSLLSSGKARGYYAKAAPPTVTMPRLKVYLTFQIKHNFLCDVLHLIITYRLWSLVQLVVFWMWHLTLTRKFY